MLTELIYVGVHMAECIFEFIKVIGVEWHFNIQAKNNVLQFRCSSCI